jgi:diguanylate cyclase (GGDEF)-like protein
MQWGAIARRRAITDELTGLYNRRFLEDSIKERFQNGTVELRKMSLMMLDLDKVHDINDRYGPVAGDRVIIAVAEVIRSVMRSSDVCARLSGDEFAILLPDTGDADTLRIADRLRETISLREVPVPEQPGAETTVTLYPRTSIGVAAAPAQGDSLEALMQNADWGLRKAKALGRNRVELAG